MQCNVLSSRVANFAPKFLLGISLLVLLTACAGPSPYEDETETTTPPVKTSNIPTPTVPSVKPVENSNKVALLVPMTGRGSDAGQAMLNAAQLAMFDLGANSFELIPEDTGTSASFAARDAIGKGAKLILGPLFAADAKTVAPIAQQSNVNVISFSTDASVAGPNTFILGFLPQSQLNRVVEYAGNKGLNRIALIAPHDAYGNAIASTFEASLSQRSLASAGVIRYDGEQPTPDQIAKITAMNPTAILIAANAAQSDVISQMLPANIQRLGTGLWEGADASKYSSLKGAWYAASSPKSRQKFEKKYNDTYGASPPRLASLAYDAAALAVVLSRQGQNFDHNALSNPNGFAGIDGIFRFLPNGQNERGLAILEIGNGSATVVQDPPSNFR